MGCSASSARTAARTSPFPARVPARFSNRERSSSTACHMPSRLFPPNPPAGCEARMMNSFANRERYTTILSDIWPRHSREGSGFAQCQDLFGPAERALQVVEHGGCQPDPVTAEGNGVVQSQPFPLGAAVHVDLQVQVGERVTALSRRNPGGNAVGRIDQAREPGKVAAVGGTGQRVVGA